MLGEGLCRGHTTKSWIDSQSSLSPELYPCNMWSSAGLKETHMVPSKVAAGMEHQGVLGATDFTKHVNICFEGLGGATASIC